VIAPRASSAAGLLVAASCLVPALQVRAQDVPRWGVWAQAGVGPAAPYEIGAVGSIAIRRFRWVVRARYATSAEYLGDYREDVGVLVGRVVGPTDGRGRWTFSAGVGRSSGSRGCILCGSTPNPDRTAVLLDVEGRYALTGFLGLTATGFASLANGASFGGLAFGLYLGTR